MTLIKTTGKWQSQIHVDGGVIYIGKFDTELQAAREYDVYSLRHRGYRSNFPTAKDRALNPVAARTSSYRGVSLDKRNGRWKAQIRVNNRAYYLGSFDTEAAAAKAFDRESVRQGTNHCLNFPESASEFAFAALEDATGSARNRASYKRAARRLPPPPAGAVLLSGGSTAAGSVNRLTPQQQALPQPWVHDGRRATPREGGGGGGQGGGAGSDSPRRSPRRTKGSKQLGPQFSAF